MTANASFVDFVVAFDELVDFLFRNGSGKFGFELGETFVLTIDRGLNLFLAGRDRHFVFSLPRRAFRYLMSGY